MVTDNYWNSSHSQLAHLPQLPHSLSNSKLQVLPSHNLTLSNSPPPNPPESDRDKFKCLYLLVETAVAVRQLEKEQGDGNV